MDPESGKKLIKDIWRDNWESFNKDCVVGDIVSMSNFLDVMMALWFFQRMFLLLYEIYEKIFKHLGAHSVLTNGSTKYTHAE